MSKAWQFIATYVIVSLIIFTSLMGCGFLKPMPERQTYQSRLKAFPINQLPLHGKAEIFWNKYQIPFIHASDDRDVPMLLGMVHAHLRLGQMEFLRRASQGRLSEMLGPFTVDIDHSIRIINFTKAVPEIKAGLPTETKAWLQSYCDGINFYMRNCTNLPPVLSVLAIKPETWTVEDLLTLGRLATTDVNWLFWTLQFRIKAQPAWPELWARLKAHGRTSIPSFEPLDNMPAQLMLAASKAGSNSFVVSGQRTKSGSSLIASDPHVGLLLPPLWLIVGYQSPSYHVLGLSIPGQPVVVVGRNASIAWGGTNMMSLSSTFYDISDASHDQLHERQERIKVRWWFDRLVTVRESALGPVVTDSKYLKKNGLPHLALKWRGHTFSDEFSTFIKISRAANWDDFQAAFETWAVSGQNFLYADRQGHIGQLLAVEFAPAAARTGEAIFGDPQNPNHLWSVSLNSTDLPSIVDPPQGFLVSTNNTPIKTDLPISLFGNSNDRFLTISAELGKAKPATIKDLMQVQTNVFSRNSLKLAQTIVSQAENPPVDTERLLSAMAAWDGTYAVASSGAAALELTAYFLADAYYSARYGEAIGAAMIRSPAVYTFLYEDLQAGQLDNYLPGALKKQLRNLKSLTPGEICTF